jgi:hypothetical protein
MDILNNFSYLYLNTSLLSTFIFNGILGFLTFFASIRYCGCYKASSISLKYILAFFSVYFMAKSFMIVSYPTSNLDDMALNKVSDIIIYLITSSIMFLKFSSLFVDELIRK